MPQWRIGLTKSLHKTRSMPESRYIQLATVDSQGMPHCRTVVFRGLTDDNKLVVLSDRRTDKYTQLAHHKYAEVCWYFSKTREQYRFSVVAELIAGCDHKTLADDHWARLSDAGKKQFMWGDPGTPRNSTIPLKVDGDMNVTPAHFCVLLLDVEKVDYLNLRGNPQSREYHHKNGQGSWRCQSVIP